MLIDRKKRSFIINVVGFGLTGLVYFLIFFTNLIHTNQGIFHPLLNGWFGIWVSIFGTLCVIEYLKNDTISIVKLSLVSIALSLVYFFGFFIIGNFVEITIQSYLEKIWIGALFVAYFIFLGGLNGYFGVYIALFNIGIALLSILTEGNTSSPTLWVDVLSLAGVSNPYVQWGIVFLSGLLGLSDKGLELLDFFNN